MARQYSRVPLVIAAIYAFIGCLWILLSDRAVGLLTSDPATITSISMFKGWMYVLLTAILLYWLIRRHVFAARLSEDRLRTSEETFSRAFNYSPALMTISTIDDGSFIEVNERFCLVSGFSRQECIGRKAVEMGWISAASRERMLRALRRDGRVTDMEIELTAKNGRSICSLFSGEIVTIGGEQYLLAIALDITQRKEAEAALRDLNEHLEQLVKERTAELEQSNEELATFCYAISHELRAPIVRLQGFSNILGETCKGDDETAFLAARIEKASIQVQTIVDSILMLSHLSKAELSLQQVDLSEAAARKLELLLDEHPERNVAADIMPGVTAVADPGLLEICLDNLISNALKFTGQAADARIEIGSFRDSGKEVYFVRDNGTGFDMAYAEQLYAPFQRLHQQKDFPGTGIGLATVKKIVNRHGGELWAESRVGQGATFYFTLGCSR